MGGFNQLLKSQEEHEGDQGPVGQELAMASKYWRGRRRFPDFDFLNAFIAFLFGTRMELKPIPVRIRRRR